MLDAYKQKRRLLCREIRRQHNLIVVLADQIAAQKAAGIAEILNDNISNVKTKLTRLYIRDMKRRFFRTFE